MYQDGVFITEIAQRTGFGTTTIYRWAVEAGVVRPFSERLASSGSRQFGQEVIGKKGAFHTSKGDRWIHTDSTYEFARLEQLEEVDSIASISRCRDRISYTFSGRTHTYIPDFTIEFSRGLVVVEEVKPARWVSDPRVRAKVAAAVSFYAKSPKIEFRVITEDDIGKDRIKAAWDSCQERLSQEAIDAAAHRRRDRRAIAQRAYTARKRANASPEQLAEMRNKNNMFQRRYRALRKNKQAA